MKGNFLVIYILSWGLLYGGSTSDDISVLHKNIGQGLIKIRKNNPELQSEVYTLLDQVGKLCRLSNIAIQKKKRMKRASIEEREMRLVLKIENEQLKSRLVALNKEVKNEHHKFAENKQRINVLVKEKSELAQKKHEYESKEREYRDKVRELETSMAKATLPFPEEPPAKLSKNSSSKKLTPAKEVRG